MLDRIIGVITLKAPTYRAIADDQTATTQAAVIVVIAALVRGFFQGLVQVSEGTVSANVVGGIVSAIVAVILGLIAWAFTSWVLALVAGALGGKTNTGEMLRVTGYVAVFNLVAILNILALVSVALACVAGLIGLIVAILSLIGYVIGVREAAEFTTGNAIITSIIAAIVNFVIVGLIGGAVIGVVIGALALAA